MVLRQNLEPPFSSIPPQSSIPVLSFHQVKSKLSKKFFELKRQHKFTSSDIRTKIHQLQQIQTDYHNAGYLDLTSSRMISRQSPRSHSNSPSAERQPRHLPQHHRADGNDNFLSPSSPNLRASPIIQNIRQSPSQRRSSQVYMTATGIQKKMNPQFRHYESLINTTQSTNSHKEHRRSITPNRHLIQHLKRPNTAFGEALLPVTGSRRDKSPRTSGRSSIKRGKRHLDQNASPHSKKVNQLAKQVRHKIVRGETSATRSSYNLQRDSNLYQAKPTSYSQFYQFDPSSSQLCQGDSIYERKPKMRKKASQKQLQQLENQYLTQQQKNSARQSTIPNSSTSGTAYFNKPSTYNSEMRTLQGNLQIKTVQQGQKKGPTKKKTKKSAKIEKVHRQSDSIQSEQNHPNSLMNSGISLNQNASMHQYQSQQLMKELKSVKSENVRYKTENQVLNITIRHLKSDLQQKTSQLSHQTMEIAQMMSQMSEMQAENMRLSRILQSSQISIDRGHSTDEDVGGGIGGDGTLDSPDEAQQIRHYRQPYSYQKYQQEQQQQPEKQSKYNNFINEGNAQEQDSKFYYKPQDISLTKIMMDSQRKQDEIQRGQGQKVQGMRQKFEDEEQQRDASLERKEAGTGSQRSMGKKSQQQQQQQQQYPLQNNQSFYKCLQDFQKETQMLNKETEKILMKPSVDKKGLK